MAVAALSSARFARIALTLQAWTMTPAPKGGRLARRAPKVLVRAHARLFDAARFFAALSPQRRHRVRILAKRLRYALDVMSVALPAEPTERYVKALVELQDDLGALNDAAVAPSLLKAASGSEPFLDFVGGLLRRRELDAAQAAEKRLMLLSETPLPWRSR